MNKYSFLPFVFCLLAAMGPACAQDVQLPASRAEIALSFAPVVKKASPAVVNIYTRRKVKVQDTLSPFANDPFFRQFFGDQSGFAGRTREKVINSLGSGVIVRTDGLVVTSHHVIRDAEEITVVLADRREFEAKVLLRDTQSDLAFLQLMTKEKLPFLALRDSDQLEVGELVLAIGNPFGVGQTVTQGIISALARTAAGVSDYQFFIQTDAAINPGNSGGALVDMAGRLIGINTAIYSSSGGSNGIGFAIPSNMVAALMQGKVNEGRVVRPWLGISAQDVTSEVAESLGLNLPRGVLVSKVAEGSPAAKSGLLAGDIVLSAGGAEVNDDRSLHYRVAILPLGKPTEFRILRAGKEQALTVTLEGPPEQPPRDTRTLKGKHPLSGITVANISPAVLSELGLEESESDGVVILDPGSNNLVGGLAFEKGDLILEINSKRVTSTKQLETLLAETGQSWQIIVQRGENLLTLSVHL